MLCSMSLGKRLREVRHLRGWSQLQLAVALGDNFSQSMVSMVESGQKKMPMPRMVAAARLLNVSADFLLGLSDDPEAHGGKERQEGQVPEDLSREVSPPRAGRITPEEAIANYQLILEEPMLALRANRGSLTVEDMADIADFIRLARSEEESKGGEVGSNGRNTQS